jgi:hypothetical protein
MGDYGDPGLCPEVRAAATTGWTVTISSDGSVPGAITVRNVNGALGSTVRSGVQGTSSAVMTVAVCGTSTLRGVGGNGPAGQIAVSSTVLDSCAPGTMIPANSPPLGTVNLGGGATTAARVGPPGTTPAGDSRLGADTTLTGTSGSARPTRNGVRRGPSTSLQRRCSTWLGRRFQSGRRKRAAP